MTVFEIPVVVRADDIDDMDHVNNVDSRRFERLTEIVRSEDGTVLARGRTLWCLVSRATGRITRIPEELRACFPEGVET